MKQSKKKWRLRHNVWLGSMYGPVPVGLIFAAIVALIGFAGYYMGWWLQVPVDLGHP